MHFKKSFLFISILFCISHLGAMEDPDEPYQHELLCAFDENNSEKMSRIINRMANVDAVYDCNNDTLLHISATKGKVKFIKIFLHNGATVNIRNYMHETPLHCVVNALYISPVDECYECLKLLLNHKANVNAKDNKGKTTLHRFAELHHKHAICLKLLLEYGANINEKDILGNTPLHCAAQRGHYACLKLLLKHGANIYAKNKHGSSPLDNSVNHRHGACIYWLLYSTKDKSTLENAFYKTENSRIKQLIKCRHLFGIKKFCRFAFIQAVEDKWITGDLIKHFLLELQIGDFLYKIH